MPNKTQREKMLCGELYQASDKELADKRTAAHDRCVEFNNSSLAVEDKMYLLAEMMSSAGDKSYIEPPFYCDYLENVDIGHDSYCNFGCTFLDCAKISIGNYVKLGPNVQLFTAAHPLDPQQRKNLWEFAKPITIGDNAWIGGGSIILPGVTIGENAVIGAGSVVSKDIPANVLAVGNPCKVIRRL